MKMCKSCGTLLDDSTKFCTSCGAPQEVTKEFPLDGNSVKREDIHPKTQTVVVKSQEPETSKRGIIFGIIGTIIGGFALLVCIIIYATISFAIANEPDFPAQYFKYAISFGAFSSGIVPFVFGMIGITGRNAHPASKVFSIFSLLVAVALLIFGVIVIANGFPQVTI